MYNKVPFKILGDNLGSEFLWYTLVSPTTFGISTLRCSWFCMTVPNSTYSHLAVSFDTNNLSSVCYITYSSDGASHSMSSVIQTISSRNKSMKKSHTGNDWCGLGLICWYIASKQLVKINKHHKEISVLLFNYKCQMMNIQPTFQILK